MPSNLTISMSTPASLYFLRKPRAFSIDAPLRHLLRPSITAGSAPRPSIRSAGAPMNVSTGCERSSRPLTPSSNAVLEQEIRFHVPAAQAVRNVQPDLDAFDFGVRLGLKHSAQNRGRLDQSGGRKDGQGKSRELTACVGHGSCPLPASRFQLPASQLAPASDQLELPALLAARQLQRQRRLCSSSSPRPARTRLEAGSWELEACLRTRTSRRTGGCAGRRWCR